MPQFDPDQTLARFIEFHETQGQEFDQLPDVERRVARGQYEFHSSVDHLVRDLEQEAQRHGYELEWTFDQEKKEFEYTCKKKTLEEYEAYLAWEQEVYQEASQPRFPEVQTQEQRAWLFPLRQTDSRV